MHLVAFVCLSVCGYFISRSIQNGWAFKIVIVSTGCAIAVDHAFNFGLASESNYPPKKVPWAQKGMLCMLFHIPISESSLSLVLANVHWQPDPVHKRPQKWFSDNIASKHLR